MVIEGNFDDIRAYRDDEIPAAIERIVSDPLLVPAARYAFPDLDIEVVKQMLRQCKTTNDIQIKVMYHVVNNIVKSTSSGFESMGAERVKSDTNGWLFISNHRDITLDAMLMQFVLFRHQLPTTDISLGDNLLRPEIVFEICKANNMVRIIRKDDVSQREFLENSRHLAEYIRLRIVQEGRSLWIAQRNGRTKDGFDMTEPGLIKMFTLSGTGNFEEDFAELHIAPVAISYEFEPCDVLKAIELCRRQSEEPYRKAENEDLISILTGLKSYKGAINMTFCEPIQREELHAIAELPRVEQCKALAELIDSRIHKEYRLFANNYIAYDMLHETDQFASKYDAVDKGRFEAHLAKAREAFVAAGVEVECAYRFLLGIYANPIESKMKY